MKGLRAFVCAVAFSLPLAAGQCYPVPTSNGLVYTCTSYSSQMGNPRFDMVIPDPDTVKNSFELRLEVSAQAPVDRNDSRCVERSVETVFGYSSNYVSLHRQGVVTAEGECQVPAIDEILYCINGLNPAPTLHITSVVATSFPALVELKAQIKPSRDWGRRNFTLNYGGQYGRTAFHIFTIPDNPHYDIWRLHMVARHQNLTSEPPTSRIFIFPESSPCISEIAEDGGCVDPVLTETCLKSVPVSFRQPDPAENLKVAMHMSFKTKVTISLSRGSIPYLRPGNWMVFVTCGNLTSRCPATELSVESYPEFNLRWKLLSGVAIVILGTMLVLFSVNAIYAMAYTILYRCSPETQAKGTHERSLWPVLIGLCSKDHLLMLRMKAKKITKPVPFFPALLSLMLGVFLATTAQFVITHYGLMIRTGNRDICFYNESCYYPGKVWDLPWNHMASNLAYFVAALHIMFQAFFAETRCYFFSRKCIVALYKTMDFQQKGHLDRTDWRRLFRKADRNRSGKVSRSEWKETYSNPIGFDFIDTNKDGFLESAEWDDAFTRLDQNQNGQICELDMLNVLKDIDLRAFYAIGVAFLGEGIGSMCYHLCPSVETFQFDTCFMIPIANLFTLALVDWSQGGADEITALKYFVYILTPIWLINFIGTWYDIGVFPLGWLYWLYAFIVIAWAVCVVVAGLRRVVQVPGDCALRAMRAIQLLLVISIGASFLMPPVRNDVFSGTANLFLMLSVVVMIFVVSRQLYMEDFIFMKCTCREVGGRIIKNSYGFFLCAVAVLACICFGKKVVIVEPGTTPAQSHDVNQGCVFDIFDLHDVWHVLSAVALALFAMLLLDVRVNSWARKRGLQILFEEMPVDMSDSEGDETLVSSDTCDMSPCP